MSAAGERWSRSRPSNHPHDPSPLAAVRQAGNRALQARLGRAYMAWRGFPPTAGGCSACSSSCCWSLSPSCRCAGALFADIGDLGGARLLPPGAEGYLLGTDDLGRDILSRMFYGSRWTLYVIVLVAIIAAPIGLLVGTVSGYAGGWVDAVLMRITDIFLAFPKLILALAFVAALGPGIENAIWPSPSPPGRPTRASRAPRR
jgi:peptide/nickel transport system permease protein